MTRHGGEVLAQISCTSPPILGMTSLPSLSLVGGSFELLPPCPPVVSAVRCPGDTPDSLPLALPTHLLKCSMSILLPLSSSGFAGDVEDALPKSCCGLPRHPGTPPISLHILGVLGPSASGMWLVPVKAKRKDRELE